MSTGSSAIHAPAKILEGQGFGKRPHETIPFGGLQTSIVLMNTRKSLSINTPRRIGRNLPANENAAACHSLLPGRLGAGGGRPILL